MKAQLIVASAFVAMLAGFGWWVEGAGYRRAEADCRAGAQEQQRRLEDLRRQIETDWEQRADRLAVEQRRLDDALAEIDRAADGDAVCLAGDGLRRLKAIR